MEWLTRGLLAIPVRSVSVQFIDTPANFYTTLLQQIGRAERRVVLSALYMGTGALEQQLVDAVRRRKWERAELSVGVLLDYFRGTRKNECGQSSADMLRVVCPDCQVKLFFHPDMVGPMKSLLPKWLNEVVGLQHMKFFIFDDSILISGANLSEIYFTNRQDRYMLVENCPLLSDFFAGVFEVIAAHSLTLDEHGTIDYQRRPSRGDGDIEDVHPLEGDSETLRLQVHNKLEALVAEFERKLAVENTSTSSTSDSCIYPFLQMGPFGISQEVDLLTRLLGAEQLMNFDVTMATGYFNLHDVYAELVARHRWSPHPLDIILAAPQTNGFFGAWGMAGHIPALYVHNAWEFWRRCATGPAGDSVLLAEYNRPGWTFHAKGLWIDWPAGNGQLFTATIVGSSNYGYRSVNRDLEAQVLLVTRNEDLSKQIKEERQSITQHCRRVDAASFAAADHFVPVWVRYFSRMFRHFF